MPDRDPLLDALDADATREAGARFLDLVARYLETTGRGDGPVSTAQSPQDIAARFDGPLPAGGAPLDMVLSRLERQVLDGVTRLVHPMYMGHQVSAPLPATIWTEAVISAVNGSTAVREMSPTANAIEHQLVRWFGTLAGYGPGCGGTLTSGGTEATFTGLLAARAAALPDAWEQGVGADPPVVVYGEQAHYAVTRAIAELGLGLRAGIAIPARDHRLDVGILTATLDRLGREGRAVMAVVATAGSTPVGAFDDLEAIGALCAARGLWLHVDGAHGASALLSAKHRHRVAGIGQARTIAWDPHKMMLLPLAAGLVLAREERDLDQAFAQRAPYLFHGQAGERIWDQGVRSFQCSRRADAIKIWVALERYGADGIGRLYDRLCDTTLLLHQKLGERPDFVTLHLPESNILCFRYVGDGHATPESLDQLNFALRQRYNASGEGWITTTLLGGRRVLRTTIMNPRTGPEHLDRLLAGLARTARELAAGA
ncbi:MAG: pyridoxal-dependent decarboxylase [Gemmatimonadetes bacterium]|nr:pyridoxal-dependent decarboxylase [Gemmatimonadota bacterium]